MQETETTAVVGGTDGVVLVQDATESGASLWTALSAAREPARSHDGLLVSFGQTAALVEQFGDSFERSSAGTLGVIDVGESRTVFDGQLVARTLEDPQDLVALQSAIEELLELLGTTQSEMTVYFDDVDAVREHAGDAAAATFFEWLTDRLRSTGATGFVRTHSNTPSATLPEPVRSTFDGTLERTEVGWEFDQQRASLPATDAVLAPEAPTFDNDDLFELLSGKRRRLALYALLDSDGALSLEELTHSVLDAHSGTADGNLPETESTEHRRCQIALQQNHLPKLVDAGIVAYDPDAETVSLNEAVDGLEPHLSIALAAEL